MEKEFTNQQSLEMIQSMINISRRNFRKEGFYYILWGSLFFIAALVQYIIYTVYKSELHWLSWMVAGALAVVINFFIMWKKNNVPKVKTYIDRVNFYLWTGFVTSILFIGFLASQQILTPIQINPLIIMLYGFTTFISGGMLRFKWLIAGGIVAWIMAGVSGFQTYETQMLLVAATILLSYLIPGIMLKYSKEDYV